MTIKLWELSTPRGLSTGITKTGVCKKTFVGHKDFILSVALSPDGQWIVSGSKDRGVQFWDPHTGRPEFMLQGHKNSGIFNYFLIFFNSLSHFCGIITIVCRKAICDRKW